MLSKSPKDDLRGEIEMSSIILYIQTQFLDYKIIPCVLWIPSNIREIIKVIRLIPWHVDERIDE